MQDISAVIVAGGKNSRIGGQNKSWLSVDNQSIFERQLAVLKPIFSAVFVVTNHPEDYLGIKSTQDVYLNSGPLAGIHAALLFAATPAIFVFSCDMPFLSAPLIEMMIADFRKYGGDVLIPTNQQKIEPLHAIYHKSTICAIEEMLKNKIFRIRGLFPHCDVRFFDVPLGIDYGAAFFNINDPLDLQNAESHAKQTK